jgi:hypothetical protein
LLGLKAIRLGAIQETPIFLPLNSSTNTSAISVALAILGYSIVCPGFSGSGKVPQVPSKNSAILLQAF